VQKTEKSILQVGMSQLSTIYGIRTGFEFGYLVGELQF